MLMFPCNIRVVGEANLANYIFIYEKRKFMLKLKIGEIMTIKLTSGEELIAKVIGISNESIEVEQPVSIGPTPNGQMGLVPSLFTYNHNVSVTLNTNAVAIVAETDESIKARYIEATTGLRMPDKKVILG